MIDMNKLNFNNFGDKRNICARIVMILKGKKDDRGLELISTRSRALCKNEIHEIIITDEAYAGPGKTINSISYLGFVEIIDGGVILTGDNVYLNNNLIGKVAGYDETHFPNHINIVIYSENRLTGLEVGAQVDDLLYFIGCSI